MENKKTTFILPDEITIIDVISEILINNNLESSSSDILNKLRREKISKFIIIRDAALSFAGKKITEKDLLLSLQKQLDISEDSAKKIVNDIKQKLMPFAKIINFDVEESPPPKVSSDEEDSFSPFVKKPDVLNVEENKKLIDRPAFLKDAVPKKYNVEKEEKLKDIAIQKPIKNNANDSYREPIE